MALSYHAPRLTLRAIAFATTAPYKGLVSPRKITPAVVIQDERRNVDPSLSIPPLRVFSLSNFDSFTLRL